MQNSALAAVDTASEALIGLLDSSGALDGESVQRAAYKLRLAVTRALGDSERLVAAQQSLAELDDAELSRSPVDVPRG